MSSRRRRTASPQRLTAHARAEGPWTAGQLRALDAAAVGATLGLTREHQLTRLYRPRSTTSAASSATAPMQASSATAPRTSPSGSRRACRSSTTAASTSARRSPPTTSHLAGVVDFADIDRLTIFADNLVPHVLRLDGVLRYSDELARAIDEGRAADRGRRVRARAARMRRARVRRARRASSVSPPRLLDNWLWNRGQHPPYSERPAHITRTVYY